MSTIADYSVFTKAFLASGMTDFSKLYGMMTVQDPGGSGREFEALRAFAVIPFKFDTPLTPREAMNFDLSKLGLTSESMARRVSCRDANGNFIGNIVRVQPSQRDGSIRFVAKVAVQEIVSSEDGSNPADAPYNTFVLVRTDDSMNIDLPIAVATISKGYNLHRHKVVVTSLEGQSDDNFSDPLDDVENANYVSFTINNLNGYTSVDFNPDAYATYDDVANALSRGIDGLHIAFDTASGDLKLLDKDGNVLDQANLPIKADVIIADGEEGYKYVKTDVKQDIHAAKAWMPEGFTAWEAVGEVQYTRKHAALVVGKGSTPASKVLVDLKNGKNHTISTERVQFDHVVIGDSTYILADKNEPEARCNLHKVKGDAGEPLIQGAGISAEGKVTLNNDPQKSYPITNENVEVGVIKGENGTTTYVLTGPYPDDNFVAWSLDGTSSPYSGTIVTFEGSSAASKVFVSEKAGGPYPISTKSVEISYFEINNSIYMLGDEDVVQSSGTLFKVKGDAEIPRYQVTLSGGQVTITDEGPYENSSYDVKSGTVEVDVITFDGTLCVLGETGNLGGTRYRTLSTVSGVDKRVFGTIVTSGGSSADRVLGITLDEQSMYTFDEGAQPHSEINNISGGTVRWLDRKPLNEVPNHTLKYGLEAFVWTVKGDEYKSNDPFFNQLNASLRALGFHEGDDIALGTNLADLAPTDPKTSPLNEVDADEYIHGKGNKATREQEVDAQRANAKEELVAWNAQRPPLTENRQDGTIIDSSGLDVRKGRITLGCGRDGKADVLQKVNYGIQMKDRSSDQNRSDSLDFTVSQSNGTFTFDGNGHATDLTSSTLLSIEAGSYISGAPTCLILAKVEHNPDPNSENGPTVFDPVRMTAGFSVAPSYGENGLTLTLHDYRDNIKALLNPNSDNEMAPSIIEVQAIYTHRNAETIPAQQMHTYIGDWDYSQNQDHPTCSFLCNKIEEWMTAVGLTDTDTSTAEGVKLYVVIRVY